MQQWAVDINGSSCESFKFNHPKTEVFNCPADNFLLLIKKWDELCERFPHDEQLPLKVDAVTDENDSEDEETDSEENVHEVEDILDIRWSNHGRTKDKSIGHIEFKVKWKGYDKPENDTWEPGESMENCLEILKRFVISGIARKILPRPGECDVICGGPPCQRVNGMNMFRDREEPLRCEKNKQVVVYMDIVEFLQPRFMLMENVVDILRFADGVVGRYAMTRLVKMHYQARLGLMAAGRYGVPQYRQRIFLWAAAQAETLPSFPLPTHDVEKVRMGVPCDWTRNIVWFENQKPGLHRAITLRDALTDLPRIDNSEDGEEMDYFTPPHNSFQRFFRKPPVDPPQLDLMKLLDHRPYKLNDDDLQRTCIIPKKKGASFRNLPGVLILPDGSVDVEKENRLTCKSGKPLVPDYCLSMLSGKNSRSFGRLWWDETIGTVCTGASPHGQRILHPDQDRTLSVRECARVQGFPDYYNFFGSVNDRCVQVGNAVSVPTALPGNGNEEIRALTHLPADFSIAYEDALSSGN